MRSAAAEYFLVRGLKIGRNMRIQSVDTYHQPEKRAIRNTCKEKGKYLSSVDLASKKGFSWSVSKEWKINTQRYDEELAQVLE